MEPHRNFGRAMARARENLELTQAELGEKIGVKQQSVAKWENGLTFPSKKNLKLIKDTLGDFWEGGGNTRNRYMYNASQGQGSSREDLPYAFGLVNNKANDPQKPFRFESNAGRKIQENLLNYLVPYFNSNEAREQDVDYLSENFAISIMTLPDNAIRHTEMRIESALWQLHNGYRKYGYDRFRCLLLILSGSLEENPIWQRAFSFIISDANSNDLHLYTAGTGEKAANLINMLEEQYYTPAEEETQPD